MTPRRGRRNIGTIARSGTQRPARPAPAAAARRPLPELIGHFGVGFYSAFMVAEAVTLVTRRAGEAAATRWESTATGTTRSATPSGSRRHLRQAPAEAGRCRGGPRGLHRPVGPHPHRQAALGLHRRSHRAGGGFRPGSARAGAELAEAAVVAAPGGGDGAEVPGLLPADHARPDAAIAAPDREGRGPPRLPGSALRARPGAGGPLLPRRPLRAAALRAARAGPRPVPRRVAPPPPLRDGRGGRAGPAPQHLAADAAGEPPPGGHPQVADPRRPRPAGRAAAAGTRHVPAVLVAVRPGAEGRAGHRLPEPRPPALAVPVRVVEPSQRAHHPRRVRGAHEAGPAGHLLPERGFARGRRARAARRGRPRARVRGAVPGGPGGRHPGSVAAGVRRQARALAGQGHAGIGSPPRLRTSSRWPGAWKSCSPST